MEAFLTGTIRKQKEIAVGGGESKKEKHAKLLPWVEKYRPKTVVQIEFQEEVVAVLKKCLQQGSEIPNLLFYGPPGTGKTSAILATCRELFGDADMRDRVKELNASDERGIQVIREQVKNFAQTAASSRRSDGKTCPALKIVILDEADSMTSAAQAALRRTMERESRKTRFCLICNYISRIIEPLTSRCAKFRFKPLSAQAQKDRLKWICDQEEVKISENALDALIEVCEGDLRKSITYLQSAARFSGGEEISESDINELAGVVPEEWMDKVFAACRTGSYEKLEICMQNLLREGFPAYQVMSQVHDRLILDEEFKDMDKAVICDKLGLCEKRLLDGADEYLQLTDLACAIMLRYKKFNI